MVEEKIKREWEVRLEELDVKQHELRNRAKELENEVESLEGELAQHRIKKYRTELADKLRRCFSSTFRERDALVEPRVGSMQGWNVCSRKLKAYIILRNGLDGEEAGACRDVSELKGYLRAKLNLEMKGNVEEEILDLL
jgi:hypothetical protein